MKRVDEPLAGRGSLGSPAAGGDESERAFIRRFAFAAAGAAVVFCAWGVAGWILTRSKPDWALTHLISLPPASALLLLLLSGGLFRRLRRADWNRTSGLEVGVGIVVTIFGLIGVAGQWWEPGPAAAGQTGLSAAAWVNAVLAVVLAQMEWGTSFLLCLSGAAVLLSGSQTRVLRTLVGILGAFIALSGFLALVGLFHGVQPAGPAGHALISGPAAAVFALLGLAVVMMAGSDHFLVRSWTGESVRARLLRTFVPLTAATVMGSDILITWSQGQAKESVALVTASASLVFTGITVLMAIKASQVLGRELDLAEKRLQAAKEELETRVAERTRELQEANRRLQDELGTRQRMEELLQSFSRRLMEAQETERRNLARELHDEIGQVLTAVKVNLQVIQRGATAAQSSQLEESVRAVEQAMKQVRNLSLELRPSVLDDFGLVSALEWLTERMGQRAGWHTTLVAEPREMRPPALIETACYRVAQAALTNTLRHAQATRVRVEVRERGDTLDLRIEDNGAGFDVAAALERTRRGASLGLLSMQERAWLVGGVIQLHSQPGQGTTIEASFPMTKPRPDEILPEPKPKLS